MTLESGLEAKIDQAFRDTWPAGEDAIRSYLVPFIAEFEQSDCRDAHYLDEFLSRDPAALAARIWEALLFERFRRQAWSVSGTGEGPDFVLNDQVYVEAVTAQPGDPERGGLPSEWQNRTSGETVPVPIEEMLLRWTSVIKVKRDKFLSEIECRKVVPDRPFVIAVNSCRLGSDTHGIGGVPLAAMAVLPFGNPTAQIDVKTGNEIGAWHLEWHDAIVKFNGEEIRTDSFLREDYECVSALVGCSGFYVDEADREKFSGQPPYFVVHNPFATCPLPQPWLSGAIEYVGTVNKPGSIELRGLTSDLH